MDNRVKSGTEYTVPATGASFRIDGPAGFDVVYWVMSPLELGQAVRHPNICADRTASRESCCRRT